MLDMTPQKALAALQRAAQSKLTPGIVYQLAFVVKQSIEKAEVLEAQIKNAQAENTELVIRVAELEEELEAAKAPAQPVAKKRGRPSTRRKTSSEE